MAPKKYKPNAFMCLVHEMLKTSKGSMTMDEARDQAGPIWREMTTDERAVYYERAKKTPSHWRQPDPNERLNTYGTKIGDVEKAKETREAKERNMKRDIESTVRNSKLNADFEKHKYYFIMVNYFTHTDPGDVFVPAELSVCEFSLIDGVTRKYHTFINPGVEMYGHLNQAKDHANKTHRLPLPPKAMGEKNLTRIFEDVNSFIGNDLESESNVPVYTHRDAIPIVESVLKFLAMEHPLLQAEKKLPVYSIQHLLFIMKEAACEIGELPKIESHHISDAYFENDVFEYHAGLSCNYHEELDKSKYCTQSIVTRWGFMFCKYMCSDVAISLVHGRHAPKEVKVTYAVIDGGSPPRKREKGDDDDDFNGPSGSMKKFKRNKY